MDVNKVILVGRVGKDVDLRYTGEGTPVANFTVATSKKYKDRSGESQEKTEWHQMVAWRDLAEVCSKHIYKGREVYIEGEIQYRSYNDRDGNKKYVTEIVVCFMKALGKNEHKEEKMMGTEPEQNEPFTGGFNPDVEDIPF